MKATKQQNEQKGPGTAPAKQTATAVETAGAKQVPDSEKLTKSESAKLKKLEATISAAEEQFWELMGALKQIHDERLYRAEYTSFQNYCESKWGMSRAHAYRCVKAVGVYESLKGLQVGDKAAPLPQTEAQIRPITQLSPDNWDAAWTKTIELAKDQPITETMVKSAVAEFKAKEGKPVAATGKRAAATIDLAGIRKWFKELAALLQEMDREDIQAAMRQIGIRLAGEKIEDDEEAAEPEVKILKPASEAPKPVKRKAKPQQREEITEEPAD